MMTGILGYYQITGGSGATVHEYSSRFGTPLVRRFHKLTAEVIGQTEVMSKPSAYNTTRLFLSFEINMLRQYQNL